MAGLAGAMRAVNMAMFGTEYGVAWPDLSGVPAGVHHTEPLAPELDGMESSLVESEPIDLDALIREFGPLEGFPTPEQPTANKADQDHPASPLSEPLSMPLSNEHVGPGSSSDESEDIDLEGQLRDLEAMGALITPKWSELDQADSVDGESSDPARATEPSSRSPAQFAVPAPSKASAESKGRKRSREETIDLTVEDDDEVQLADEAPEVESPNKRARTAAPETSNPLHVPFDHANFVEEQRVAGMGAPNREEEKGRKKASYARDQRAFARMQRESGATLAHDMAQYRATITAQSTSSGCGKVIGSAENGAGEKIIESVWADGAGDYAF